MTTLHSTVNTPLRLALKQMLQEFKATHALTLAFHEPVNIVRATARVARWRHSMMRRLFGRSWFNLPDQGVPFLLLPEVRSAHLHFHGVVRLPTSHVAYFERVALPQWKRVSPRGTLDLQVLTEPEGWFSYVTKEAGALEILHSSMLPLPEPADGARRQLNGIRRSRPDTSGYRRDPVLISGLAING